MQAIDKISVINGLSSIDLGFYFKRVMNTEQVAEMSKKSETELREMLINEITNEDLVFLNLVQPKKTKEVTTAPPADVPELNFSRLSENKQKNLDLTA